MSRLPGLTGTIDWSVANPNGERTMLLLHSLGTDRSIWEGQIRTLTAAGRRVVAIDLPGHGLSSAAIGPYTIDTLGRDIKEVSEIVEPGGFEVMGMSLGGLVAMWLAVEASERVTALVAANTGPRLASKALWDHRIAAVRRDGLGAIREEVVARFFATGFREAHPDLFARYNDIFSSTDPMGYMGCCTVLRDTDLTPKIAFIRCPTLVIGGEVDIAAPYQQSEWLHEEIERSRLEVIEGAGHLSNIDRPEAFNRVVGEFLSDL